MLISSHHVEILSLGNFFELDFLKK